MKFTSGSLPAFCNCCISQAVFCPICNSLFIISSTELPTKLSSRIVNCVEGSLTSCKNSCCHVAGFASSKCSAPMVAASVRNPGTPCPSRKCRGFGGGSLPQNLHLPQSLDSQPCSVASAIPCAAASSPFVMMPPCPIMVMPFT